MLCPNTGPSQNHFLLKCSLPFAWSRRSTVRASCPQLSFAFRSSSFGSPTPLPPSASCGFARARRQDRNYRDSRRRRSSNQRSLQRSDLRCSLSSMLRVGGPNCYKPLHTLPVGNVDLGHQEVKQAAQTLLGRGEGGRAVIWRPPWRLSRADNERGLSCIFRVALHSLRPSVRRLRLRRILTRRNYRVGPSVPSSCRGNMSRGKRCKHGQEDGHSNCLMPTVTSMISLFHYYGQAT